LNNRPALSDIETWIFDLDNTLYPRECELFAQIDRRMGEYISRYLSIHFDDARHVQKLFFREFGTTLNGLMQVYKMDPGPFLDYVHDIDHSMLPDSPELDAALGALPGRKVIYTNGSVRHAENVAGRLGILPHFDAIFDIVASDYRPKPNPEPYGAMIRQFSIDPARAAMVEDMARNLKPAHDLGMATIYVETDEHWARAGEDGDHIDHKTGDLAGFLAAVAGEPIID